MFCKREYRSHFLAARRVRRVYVGPNGDLRTGVRMRTVIVRLHCVTSEGSRRSQSKAKVKGEGQGRRSRSKAAAASGEGRSRSAELAGGVRPTSWLGGSVLPVSATRAISFSGRRRSLRTGLGRARRRRPENLVGLRPLTGRTDPPPCFKLP